MLKKLLTCSIIALSLGACANSNNSSVTRQTSFYTNHCLDVFRNYGKKRIDPVVVSWAGTDCKTNKVLWAGGQAFENPSVALMSSGFAAAGMIGAAGIFATQVGSTISGSSINVDVK